MKRTSKILLVLLLLLWGTYVLWEIQLQRWIEITKNGGAVLRVDLIIVLPFLLIFSFYVIQIIIKNRKQ